MAALTGPLSVRLLDEPHEYAPFIDFCCGKEDGPAHEVNRTVRFLHANTTRMPQIPAILEKPQGKDITGNSPLVGVCSISTWFPLPHVDPAIPSIYIVALGVDLLYQGDKLNGRSAGDALLDGTFEEARVRAPKAVMPYAWAKVKLDNERSSRLLDRHGFDNEGEAAGEYVLLRKPELDPSFRREPGWSLDT